MSLAKPQLAGNLVDGEWKQASTAQTFEDVNPANTREVIGNFPQSSREDGRAAIDAAERAREKWSRTPPPLRGKILFKAAEILEQQKEELARILTREEGKPLAESRAEVNRAVDIFRFFAGEGSRLNGEVIASEDSDTKLYTLRQPLGIVSVITPWNFPIAIPAWKIAPALICGNTVVFKPASLTPLIALKVVEALKNARIPPGVINFLTGPGSTVGLELIDNEKITGISFTGSYEVGDRIYKSCSQGEAMPRIQLEMGGKNPLVVLSDADLGKAVEITVKGGFGGTGQACTATSRVIVEQPVLEKYTQLLTERVKKIRVGNGLDESNEMGPAVSEQELKKDLVYVEVGKAESAKLVVGGKRLRGGEYDQGYFMEPTVFTDVNSTMRIAKEEIFGPVVSVLAANNFDHALELANDAQYGLSASIATNNLEKAHVFIDRIQAGVVKVNRPTTGIMAQAPFGGMKKSSSMTFKEQGKAAIDFYTFIKTVYLGIRP
jgi:aldehyde dehydrogenase (NAD+)